MTVSGDGLCHEVINGLMNRKDWQSRDSGSEPGLKDSITLGLVPGGTGNGLIRSLLARGEEDYGVKEAAFRIVKGRHVLIDLTQLDLEYERKTVYSFLCFLWAIMSDIDLNSEACRCCGPMRFTMWGVFRALFLREYFGSLRYTGFICNNSRVVRQSVSSQSFKEVPLEVSKRNAPSGGSTAGAMMHTSGHTSLSQVNQHFINQNFQYFVAMNAPFVSFDNNIAPLSQLDDGCNDLVILRGQNGGRVRMTRMLLEMEKGAYFSE